MSVNEGFMDTLNCFICGMKILLLFIFYLKDKIRPLEKDAPPPPQKCHRIIMIFNIIVFVIHGFIIE